MRHQVLLSRLHSSLYPDKAIDPLIIFLADGANVSLGNGNGILNTSAVAQVRLAHT